MKRSEVQVLLGPPGSFFTKRRFRNRSNKGTTQIQNPGDLAQLVEHLLCKQGVRGSTPLVSTNEKPARNGGFYFF